MAPNITDASLPTPDEPPLLPRESEGGRRHKPRGTNQSRLKFLRRKVKEEMGAEYVKKLHTSYWLIDIPLNVLFPMLSTPLWQYYTIDWDLTNPITFILWSLFGGWLAISGVGCFHDLTHRLPGGYVVGRILGKMASISAPRVGETFYKRHQMHHAMMFEQGDTKIRRFNTNHADTKRLTSNLFPFLIMMRFYQQMDTEHYAEAGVKINKVVYYFEMFCSMCNISFQVWICGWWVLVRAFYTSLGCHFWNGMRECLEHAGQDFDDDIAQGTFVELPLWLKLAWFSVPMGTGHHVHHLFPKAPNYQILWRGDEMNPLMRKLGIREKKSVWHLFYDYYIAKTPYCSCEPSKNA